MSSVPIKIEMQSVPIKIEKKSQRLQVYPQSILYPGAGDAEAHSHAAWAETPLPRLAYDHNKGYENAVAGAGEPFRAQFMEYSKERS